MLYTVYNLLKAFDFILSLNASGLFGTVATSKILLLFKAFNN